MTSSPHSQMSLTDTVACVGALDEFLVVLFRLVAKWSTTDAWNEIAPLQNNSHEGFLGVILTSKPSSLGASTSHAAESPFILNLRTSLWGRELPRIKNCPAPSSFDIDQFSGVVVWDTTVGGKKWVIWRDQIIIIRHRNQSCHPGKLMELPKPRKINRGSKATLGVKKSLCHFGSL